MGYATWKPWVVEKLETITGLNVYDHPTDKISFPAATVKVGESLADTGQETNQSVFRNYDINVDLTVGANSVYQDIDDVERIFMEKLDAIIELFDARANWHPDDDIASRCRVSRVTPKDSISPEAKRIATVTLTFYKRNR